MGKAFTSRPWPTALRVRSVPLSGQAPRWVPSICAVVGGPSFTEACDLRLALEQGIGSGTSPPSLGTVGYNFRVAGNASLLPPQLTSPGRAQSCRRGPGDRNWGWPLVTRQPGAESQGTAPSSDRPAVCSPPPGEPSREAGRRTPGCSVRETAPSIQPRRVGPRPTETRRARDGAAACHGGGQAAACIDRPFCPLRF